jgi:restriction system protein
MRIPEAEQEVTLKSGESKVRNQVRWARLYLAYAGYIDASKRGIWSLTEKGLSVDTLTFDAQEALNETNKRYAQGLRLKDRKKALAKEVDVEEIEMLDHRTSLLNLIKSLPPSGFERLSQRLLRESGFQKVAVTGKTGDGGIDGVGILQVTIRKLQCSLPMQTLSGSRNPFPDKGFPRRHGGKSRQGHHHYHRHIYP